MAKKLVLISLLLILVFHNKNVFSYQQPTEDPVIRIDTGLVLVNTTVTDNTGRYIANLKANDFLLEEDGKVRQISLFAAEETPFAVAILIDSSASMQNKLNRARVAAAQFAETLREDDVTAVYSFNNKVHSLQDFSGSKDISPDIWELEAKDTTALYDAMYTALEALSKRSEQRRAIIVISDGGDNASKHTEKQVLEQAVKTSANIYTIDITDMTDSKNANSMIASGLLKNFSDKTGGQYLKTVGGKQLSERLLEVSKELRAQYTLGFYPEKQEKGKPHKLLVKVPKQQNAQVRARQSY
jgi:Ca-activated chloride channel family protein